MERRLILVHLARLKFLGSFLLKTWWFDEKYIDSASLSETLHEINSLILSVIYGDKELLQLLSSQDSIGKVSVELIKRQLAIIWKTNSTDSYFDGRRRTICSVSPASHIIIGLIFPHNLDFIHNLSSSPMFFLIYFFQLPYSVEPSVLHKCPWWNI